MRLFIKKRTTGEIEFGILYGGIALLILCAAHFLPVQIFLPPCAFKGLTSFPCPACGSSRAIIHMAHGDILSSISMNPLIAFCFIVAVVIFLYSLLTFSFDVSRIGITLEEREKHAIRVGAILLMLANWNYLALTL